MSVAEEISRRILAALDPAVLEVIDESEKHRGHAGYREGGQSHFRVEITAPGLDGLSRVQRHRAVHDALGAELLARIHALAIVFGQPDQPDQSLSEGGS